MQRTDAGTQQVLQQADGTGSIAIRWRRGRPQGQLAEGLKAELASRVGTPVAVTARDKVRLAGVAADVVTLTAGAAGGENGGALLWTRGALAVRPGRDFAMIVATVALPEDRSDTFGAMDAVLRSWGWT